MTKIVFIEPNQTEHVVDAEGGLSVMQSAVDNFVPGIAADCGGCCSCGTCYGHIDEAWLEKLEPKSDEEARTLEGVLDLRHNSRLTCQIQVCDQLDGLVIHLPAEQ
jgi:2Fe-2S ferredoxin